MARTFVIKTVVAYEDFSGAIRAREMADRLTARLKPGFEVSTDLWRFDFLRYSEFREQASKAAVPADLIIFSARGKAELPIHVKEWIEMWLPDKRSDAALVAIFEHFEEIPGHTPSPCAYLRQVAQRTGMDFFFKAGNDGQQDITNLVAGRYKPLVQSFALQPGASPEISPWQGWGINE